MSAQTSRPGLYVLVFLILLNSCDAADKANQSVNALKRIADSVKDRQ
jgi:hypothetical protein